MARPCGGASRQGICVLACRPTKPEAEPGSTKPITVPILSQVTSSTTAGTKRIGAPPLSFYNLETAGRGWPRRRKWWNYGQWSSGGGWKDNSEQWSSSGGWKDNSEQWSSGGGWKDNSEQTGSGKRRKVADGHEGTGPSSSCASKVIPPWR